jgi:hypothetical protein
MPSFIPTSFDRIRTTKIACANGGWVYVKPMQGGDRYYITANGRRAETVDRRDVYYVVRDIVNSMGGLVPYMPGPLPRDYESAEAVVAGLTEADDPELGRIRKRVGQAKKERLAREMAANPDIQQADDPNVFLQGEVERRSEPIKKLEIRGRRWYRRGAGGVYCKAYIYINDKLVHTTPEQYGYGDHYLTLAKDWLTRNGYLEGLLDDERDPIWYLRDKHGIDLQYGVTDVPRERDL